MVVLALAAPAVSTIWPSQAVVAGAIAGLWLFLGRTVLLAAQSRTTDQAAAVQEQFDFFVFGMPDSAARSIVPTLEEIAAIGGTGQKLESEASEEKLHDWYPFDESDDGVVAVAIAQRANAAYSDRLLRNTAAVWGTAVAAWIVVLTVGAVALHLRFATIVMGIFLPTLPAMLDVIQYIYGVWRSAGERADLARAISERLSGTPDFPDPEDLLRWQERFYALRRTAPQVPDFVYILNRAVNESAMRSAAAQLRSRVHRARGD
jgi:hypothetical protein